MIASPRSGHGFKHSAAIDEALAGQVIDGKSKIDISSFSLKRFINFNSISSGRVIEANTSKMY